MNSLKAAIYAAALVFAVETQAATVSALRVTGYQSSTSQTVAFDINSAWNGSDPLLAARIHATFRDDGDREYQSSSRIQTGSYQQQVGVETYSCGFGGTCTRPIFQTRPIYSTVRKYYDAREAAVLRIGSQTASESTRFYIANTGTLEKTTGYKGSIVFNMVLDALNLADLADDGILTANLRISGDLVVESMALEFYTRPALPMTPVPLPASAALLLAGLGGLAAVKRKARK